jgi:hypothetical protein
VFTDAQIARFYPGNHNSDFTGIFGAASELGEDISGQAFKAVVTTDVALAPSTYTDPTTGDVDEIYAPAANSAQFSTVALTINGVTVSWTENQAGSEVAESGPFQESLVKTFIHGAGSMNTSEVFDMQVAARPLNSFDFPSDLAAPGTYSVQPAGENIVDLFNISVVGVTPMVDSGGFLDPTSLTVSGLAAPEPSAWAMLLVGFACVGRGLRARRRGLASSPSGQAHRLVT